MRTFVPQRQRKCQRSLLAVRQVPRILVSRDIAGVKHTCPYFVTVSRVGHRDLQAGPDSAEQRVEGSTGSCLIFLHFLLPAR